MKWSAPVIVMLALLAFAGEIQAKGQPQPVDLDDVELDAPAEPAPKPKPATKPASKPTPAPVAKTVVAEEKVSDDVRAALEKADLLEKAKDFDGVIKVLKPLMDQLPRKGLLQIARSYKATKDIPSEITALQLVTAKNPKDYVAQTQLGDALFRGKRYAEAGTAFNEAKTLNNRYRPAYDGLWSLLEVSDSKYEARTLVLDMVKIFGPDAKTAAALCRMYSTEDFLEKSAETCKTAIELDPKKPENYVYLAKTLRDQEQKDQSVKVIVDAAKIFSTSEEVQSLAGELKFADKDFSEAYRYYKQATTANPKSVPAQIGFANSAFEIQKLEESMAAYKAACRLDRKSGRDFRASFLKLKNLKDPRWIQWQTALEACE